jgi:hypothetical protein
MEFPSLLEIAAGTERPRNDTVKSGEETYIFTNPHSHKPDDSGTSLNKETVKLQGGCLFLTLDDFSSDGSCEYRCGLTHRQHFGKIAREIRIILRDAHEGGEPLQGLLLRI